MSRVTTVGRMYVGLQTPGYGDGTPQVEGTSGVGNSSVGKSSTGNPLTRRGRPRAETVALVIATGVANRSIGRARR